MIIARCLSCLVLAVILTACGGGEEAVMPDLAGKRLDIAQSDLGRAGYDDEAEVIGGGTFGVLDESNWTVCDQEPDPGTTLSSTPRLTVDRTCEDLDGLDGETSEEQADDEPSAGKPSEKETRKPR